VAKFGPYQQEGVVETGKPKVRLTLELLVLLLLYRNIWRRWCANSMVLYTAPVSPRKFAQIVDEKLDI
jgi:hypothetical protein